ncbi:MAG: autotransporter-associated beta strand repeat-containing protein, partial [Thermoguttaceae bacterium]
MSRSKLWDVFEGFVGRLTSKKRSSKRGCGGGCHKSRRRSLLLEPLEERQLLSINLALLPHQVVDNQDSAYAEGGSNWLGWSGPGYYDGDCRYHAAGDGSDTASWTVGSLDPTKSYQVFATWAGDGSHASNAPFTVLDGTITLATVLMNQQSTPDQATLDGQNWQSLGVYQADSGGLTVRLSDNANGNVVANAICVAEVPAVTAPPAVVDNADPAYAEGGSGWLGWTGSGYYNGDCRYHAAGTGQNTASWTFADLDPTVQYQVYATWVGDSSHASNAPFTMFDGSTTLATVLMNQQSTPVDATIDGQAWQSMGVYQASSGTLVVQLSDNANGNVVANAVRLVEVTPPTTPPTVVDDGDQAYAEGGSDWLGWTGSGYYNGDCRYHAAGTGQNTAIWTFAALYPNTEYQLLTTWVGDSSHASNAPFTVFDGTSPLATVLMNQQAAPTDVTIDGQPWQSLGVFEPTSGKLVVQLSDDADGYVVADAVRLVVVDRGPTSSGIGDVTVNAGRVSSVVDLWSAFTDADEADSALTYQVTGDSNSQLFSAVGIDPATGHLTLSYAIGALGTAALTVRATDPGGLYTETTFTVTVAHPEDPVLYWYPQGGSHVWSTSAANWNDESDGSGNQSYWVNDGYEAVFSNTADTVTVNGTVVANSVAFDTSGYAIVPGTSALLSLDTGGTTISVDNSGSDAISCVIGSSYNLTKAGSGTLALTGANTYTGGTTIDAGTLAFGQGALDNSSEIIFDGGALQWASGNTEDVSGLFGSIDSGETAILDTNGNNVTLATAITGDGGLEKIGAGTLTLTGENDYAGGTTVVVGTLALSGGDNRLSTTGAITIAGGTLDLGGNGQTTSAALTFQDNSGSVVQDGTLTLSGSGTVLVADQNAEIDAEVDVTGTADRYWSVAAGKTLTLGGDVNFLGCALFLSGAGTNEFTGHVTGYDLEVAGTTATFSGESTLNVTVECVAGAWAAGALNWNSSETLTANYLWSAWRGQGVITQTDGTVDVNYLDFGLPITSAVYNLDGGELRVYAMGYAASPGYDAPATLDFGGGTLVATSDFTPTASSGYALLYTIDDGATALIDTNGHNVTLPGPISGSGGLEKLGTGTLTLSGANTYSGGTTVSSGILEAATPGSLPGYGTSGQLSVANGATVAVSAAGWDSDDIDALLANPSFTSGNLGIDVPQESSFSYSSVIGGGVGLMKLGDGTLTLTGTNTYAGGTTVSAGTLQLGGGTTDGSVSGDITDNAVLAFDNASALSYTGVVSGTGAVTMTGDGTLTLSGANLNTGGTTVAAGTLLLSGGDDRLSTSGAITIGGGVLDLDGNGQTTSGLLSFQGTSPGTVQNGTLTLTAGGTVISASQSGTIDADVVMNGSAARSWTIAQNETLTLGGTVNFTSCELSIYGPGTAEFHGAAGGSGGSNWLRGNSGVTITFEDSSSLTVLGIIVGSYSAGTLNWDSSGTLDAGYLLASYGTGGCGTINQTAGIVDGSCNGLYLGSADNYNLDGGTLRTCGISAVSGATLTFGGGTLLATGGFQVSADLSCVIPATDTATIDTNVYGLAVVVPDVISGGGSLTVTGTGTLTLTGANTYTGDTVISEGTLKLGSADAIPSGENAGNVEVDGTLDLNGYSVTVNGLSGDGTVTSGVIGSVALTVGANDQSSGFDGVIEDGSGMVSLEKTGAGVLTLTGANTYSGNTTLDDGTLSFASGALGATGNIIFDGGALQWYGTNTEDISSRVAPIASGQTAIFNIPTSNTVTLASALSGQGDVAKVGSGILILTGSNTYSGGTTTEQGTLLIGTLPSVFVDSNEITLSTDRPDAFRVTEPDCPAGQLSSPFIIDTGGLTGGSLSLEYGNQGIVAWAQTWGVNCQPGTYHLRETFTYNENTQTKVFTVNVVEEDEPPRFVCSNGSEPAQDVASGTVNFVSSAPCSALDDEDATLNYTFLPGTTAVPANPSIDSNGYFHCTLYPSDAGTIYDFFIKAADSGGQYDLLQMTIPVWSSSAPNLPLPFVVPTQSDHFQAIENQTGFVGPITVWSWSCDWPGHSPELITVMDTSPSHGYFDQDGLYVPDDGFQGMDSYSIHYQVSDSVTHEDYQTVSNVAPQYIQVGSCVDLAPEGKCAETFDSGQLGDTDMAVLGVGDTSTVTMTLQDPWTDGVPATGYWSLAFDPSKILLYDSEGDEILPG